MNNTDFLRLIITLNTSNKDFDENLLSIIKYVIWSQKKAYTEYQEIKNDIQNLLSLSFTEHEISVAIKRGLNKNILEKTSNGCFVLNAKQIECLELQDENLLQTILAKFSKTYNIKHYTTKQLDNLITTYLFKYINENINSLLTMLQKSDNIKNMSATPFNDEYTNEEKEIINKFIDWDNTEKNEILYKLISFSVDYCKLTVKKGNNAFKNLLRGKEFFLDANIIYRLMGINNPERQTITQEFITTCINAGIKIKYTNFTKYEVLISLKHNVAKMMREVGHLKIDPEKLKDNLGVELDLYNIYYKLSRENHKWFNLNDLNIYLERLFKNCVKNFEYIEYDNPKVLQSILFNSYCEQLCEYKPNIPTESIEVDVQNFISIRNARKKYINGNAWQIKQFIISADRKYVTWAGDLMYGMTPLVVLPSAWYSLILKIQGRSSDDYKSFSEFLKLRLKADKTDEVVRKILYAITQISTEQEMQEKVFDTLVASNNLIAQSKDIDDNEIDDFAISAVNSAQETVLEQYKNAGFEEGKLSGEKNGIEKGFSDGFNKGQIQEQQNIIEKLAEEKTDKHFKFIEKIDVCVSAVFLVSIIVALCGVGFFLYKHFSDGETIKQISNMAIIIEVVSGLSSIVTPIAKRLIKHICKSKEEYFEEKKEFFKQKIKYEKH